MGRDPFAGACSHMFIPLRYGPTGTHPLFVLQPPPGLLQLRGQLPLEVVAVVQLHLVLLHLLHQLHVLGAEPSPLRAHLRHLAIELLDVDVQVVDLDLELLDHLLRRHLHRTVKMRVDVIESISVAFSKIVEQCMFVYYTQFSNAVYLRSLLY